MGFNTVYSVYSKIGLDTIYLRLDGATDGGTISISMQSSHAQTLLYLGR